MYQLWSEINLDQSSASFPNAVGLFFESMEPSFSTKGDAMEAGYFGSHRTKYIHSVAGHGKVSLNSVDDHPFTGIFEGADMGIVRLSSAG